MPQALSVWSTRPEEHEKNILNSNMGVPFEALLPYGVMVVLFGVTGVGLSGLSYFKNNGKAPRRDLSLWDRQMMERDYRLTGVFRGQTDKVAAPAGFEVNSQWKMEPKIM